MYYTKKVITVVLITLLTVTISCQKTNTKPSNSISTSLETLEKATSGPSLDIYSINNICTGRLTKCALSIQVGTPSFNTIEVNFLTATVNNYPIMNFKIYDQVGNVLFNCNKNSANTVKIGTINGLDNNTQYRVVVTNPNNNLQYDEEFITTGSCIPDN